MDFIVINILETFFGRYTRLKYEKGEVILRAEDTPRGVFYLKKGYVRQYIVTESGVMLMLHIFKPHSFFPMTWVVNDEANRYYLETVTPVEIWRAPKEAVKEFLHDYPAVVYDLSCRLLLGISGLRRRMEYLVMDNAYKKTILLFFYLANNLGEKEGSSIVFPVPVTHREIAAWIGNCGMDRNHPGNGKFAGGNTQKTRADPIPPQATCDPLPQDAGKRNRRIGRLRAGQF
ncbi:MAG: Crp/Fnr family transcriptional regulator [Candidatus Gottesmanbacteria bacterium]|nr:Crp/Fnr family transcriptional regulator [Candidatus Gottesmanbacteria bacterium]